MILRARNLTAILLVILMGLPAMGHSRVECVDGSTCPPDVNASAPRECCHLEAGCDHHAGQPMDKRCVIRSVPASQRMTAAMPTLISHDFQPCLFATIGDLQIPVLTRIRASLPETPPCQPPAKQCLGARPPPPFA